MSSTKNAKNPRTLWRTLKEQEAQDDLDEILAMSDAELDSYIDENGGDAKAIRARGAALAEELLLHRKEKAWHGEMGAELESFRKKAEARRITETLSRDDLLKRIEIARNKPRFATQVATLFQKKTKEAATDEELRDLLEQMELLGMLEDEAKDKK